MQSGTNPNLGFGGVNGSGMGRLVGWNTFNEASNARTVVEEGPAFINPRLTLPPFPPTAQRLIGMLINSKPIPDFFVRLLDCVIRLAGLFKR